MDILLKFCIRYLFIILACNLILEAKLPSNHSKDTIASYLMSDDHPIKPLLDELFSSARVTFNLETLEKAGFMKTKPRKFTQLIVTRHIAFPGYIFKLYLDTQRYHNDTPEYKLWRMRIQGAEKIRNEIVQNGLESLFKVPRKWIYALPKHPMPELGYLIKYYILVEEDMDILSDQNNKALWASLFVTAEILDGLYRILKTVGLNDCTKPENIPFSHDGRIAFVDTQSFGKDVNYKNLKKYLHKSNREYWNSKYTIAQFN